MDICFRRLTVHSFVVQHNSQKIALDLRSSIFSLNVVFRTVMSRCVRDEKLGKQN